MQALVSLQKVESAWHARRARVILQHRAATSQVDSEAIESLTELFNAGESAELRLRAMWALHVIGRLSADQLQLSLGDSNAHIRAWAIQLLCEDFDPPQRAVDQFVTMAQSDSSPVVRLYLASAVQRSEDRRREMVDHRSTGPA